MIKYTEYKYHAAALFTVAVWGATFVSTKVLIAHSLTPAEIFLLRFALAYVCIWPLSKGRLRADGWRDEALLADFWYPDARAGAFGVRWVENCVRSADNGACWVDFR